MTISYTWLGHSAFLMNIEGHSVLFDPFLTGNPLASTEANSLNPEVIFVTHAHGDHTGDTVDIAKRSNAAVATNVEISEWFSRKGVETVHGFNTGGTLDLGFLTAKMTLAFHSSSFPDGTYGGNPGGYIITAKESGKRLYFAGDTALFSDMQLIGDHGIDIAFLPIGDYFTMGPADSIKAIQYIRPRYVVPMHYNTFGLIAVDGGAWASQVNQQTDATPIVLDPGGTFTLPD